MQEKRPSQTASFVALWRALADQGFTGAARFSDPVVASLLSPGWALLQRTLARRLRRHSPERRAFAISQFDTIALRVLAIDLELERAIAAGAKQLVILGAGLDTRAFRLSSLASVAVFEVDHPATQAYKRRKAASLAPLSSSLTFVPVNFERDSLAQALSAAGYRAGEPTVWIWEGVVMYLDDAALRETLTSIAACSARHSSLLIHYHEEVPASAQRSAERLVQRLMLSIWREPQIGLRTPEAMRDEVQRVGFTVERDTRTAEWARELGAAQPAGQTAAISHLLVAHRR